MNLKAAFRPTRKHAALLGAVAGVAALTLTTTTPASAAKAEHRPTGNKPTVVLVHGAFADSSSWNGVVKRLQREGYPVIAPANPLRGLASDAEYVHSVLKSVNGPVVLVGHSYGGAVISAAAVGDPQVKALVYVAAFAPAKGRARWNCPTSSPAALSVPPSTPCPSRSPAAAPAPTCTSRPTSSTTSSPPTCPSRSPT